MTFRNVDVLGNPLKRDDKFSHFHFFFPFDCSIYHQLRHIFSLEQIVFLKYDRISVSLIRVIDFFPFNPKSFFLSLCEFVFFCC